MRMISKISILLLASCSSAVPTTSTIGTETTEGASLTVGQSDPACATFCVKVTRDEVRVGEPVEGIVSWRKAPPNSILSLSLDRSGEDSQRIQNERSERFAGNLLTRSIPISGDGSIRFVWSGNGFGCYRTEIPEICPGEAAPGLHVISAVVMDKTMLFHPFAHPDVVRNAKPTTVFSGKSQAFEIR